MHIPKCPLTLLHTNVCTSYTYMCAKTSTHISFTSGEAITVDPANQKAKRSGDPPEQPITLESARPQAPLEPVVKIITGPKGKSNG